MTAATLTPGMRWSFRIAVLAVVSSFLPPGVHAEYGDVIINNFSEKSGVRPVIFPHWFHRIRFQCRVCHQELKIQMRAGSNEINMEKISDGQYCGACHNGEVAWSAENCDLCHSGRPGLTTGVRGGHMTLGPGDY